VIPTFLAPLDPSIAAAGGNTAPNSMGVNAGLISYEFNGYITDGSCWALCNFLNSCGCLNGAATNGDTAGPVPSPNHYYPTIPAAIPDGLSNTLLLAERYAFNCDYGNGTRGNRTWGEDNGGPSLWAPILIHASLFQVAPTVQNASCYNPQAYTTSGCQIALADGSVRNVTPAVSATTWWRLCLPNDGLPLGDF